MLVQTTSGTCYTEGAKKPQDRRCVNTSPTANSGIRTKGLVPLLITQCSKFPLITTQGAFRKEGKMKTADTDICRLSEQLTPGAHWCRLCYRYKIDGCEPTQKELVRFGKPTKKSRHKRWITKGNPSLRFEQEPNK